MIQTKKVDLPAILERTRASGKRINSLTFESGAGFEAQRHVDDLLRYARQHPGGLPVINIVSTAIGGTNEARLRAAGYRVTNIGKDPLVPLVVDPGPLADIPLARQGHVDSGAGGGGDVDGRLHTGRRPADQRSDGRAWNSAQPARARD
ncbi:MAG: hypothetical protein QM757_26090 [Paludibaculum sp.]